MRKALLVLALIASSFAGGAAVNGPGLKHAKHWLQDQLADAPAEAPENAPATDEPGFPTADVPRITDAPAGEPASSDPAAAPESTPSAPAAPASQQPVPPAGSEVPPLTPPAPAASVAATEPAAPPVPADVPAPPAPKAASPAPAAPTPFADAPDSKAPAHAVLPPPSGGSAATAVAAAADPAHDGSVNPAALPALPAGRNAPGAGSPSWPELHRRLTELGVTRFWVEGEPGGVVRFRCAIPVAGERAVAQQFEAEGDDPLEAADTVLRRVALWRAARGTP